jgi:putative ABC transport system permease protein
VQILAATSVAPTPDWRLAAVLVALVAVAVAASYVGRLDVERSQVTAAVRAVVQLGVVSLVITAALDSLGWSLAFVGLMFAVASVTALGRVGAPREQLPWVMAAVAAGAVPVLALILGSGTVPFNGPGIIPIAGIVIGNTMTAATLTGRRAYDEISGKLGSYEAGLALGLSGPAAAYEVIQPTAKEALTPGLDQTRTVGLVALPGAFVGTLLGGASPAQAGAVQLLVLVALLLVQAVAVVLTVELLARRRLHR